MILIMNFLNFFGLDKYINWIDTSENNQTISKHVIADVYESFLAAVYLVYGLDKVREIVLDVLSEEKIFSSMDVFVFRESVVANESKRKKINYNKIFKSIIGKKSIINYKQENFNIDKVTLSLKVNGKVLSQGEGINEKIAKNDVLKKACYKLMMEDTRNEINYKFIIQIIVGEFSKIEYIEKAKNGNNFVVELVNSGKCLAVGEGKTLKTANKHATKKACLNFMK